MRICRVVTFFCAGLLGAALPTGEAIAVPDVHGTWLVRGSGARFFTEVTQTGDAVHFADFLGRPLNGLLEDGGRIRASTGAITPGELSVELDGAVDALGRAMNLSSAVADWSDPLSVLPLQDRVALGLRCTCVDWNTTPGDGCDADCQVESCWTCVGNPSTCSPSPDGSSCDDRNDCSTGTTCAGGVCGGGTPVDACVDLTGTWSVYRERAFGGFPGEQSVITREVEQHDGLLILEDQSGETSGREFFGTLDAATRNFTLPRVNLYDLSGFCFPPQAIHEPLTGTVLSNGTTTHATGIEALYGGSRCPLGLDVLELGAREDRPQPCAGQPDLSACSNGDPCSINEFCLSGFCHPGDHVDCGACATCDRNAGCVVDGPRACTTGSSVLRLRNATRAKGDQVQWQWASPAPLTSDTLAEAPSRGAELCVFDSSASTPSLRFGARIPSEFDCSSSSCWSFLAFDRGFSFRDRSGTGDGITKLDVRHRNGRPTTAGLAGKGAGLSGRSFGLPALPLRMELRVELRGGGSSSCIASEFDATGVIQNDARRGLFWARSR